MRYLLDECLTEQAASGMAAVSAKDSNAFAYIAGSEVARSGAADDEIPGICKAGNWDVLITANVADFGARKYLYQALLENGIHVLVIRPGRQKLDEFLQLSLLARHYKQYARLLAASSGPTLAVLTEGGVRPRSLTELVEEISTDGRRPIP